MTKERIEDMREVVLPFVSKRLKETNYEGLGESDSKEFTKDFNEILDLAIKALNIDKMIAEMEQASYCDKETKMVKNCNASGLSVAIKIINKYCKENTDGEV